MAIVRADAPTELYEEFVQEVRATKERNKDGTLGHSQKPNLQFCKRCQTANDMFAHYCNRCGFPLTNQAAMDVVEREVEKTN